MVEEDRGSDFTRLADLLTAAATSIGSETVPAGSSPAAAREDRRDDRRDDRDLAREVARLWPQVVGLEIAANAAPVYLNRRRLVVSTSSPAWAQTLHMMSEDILRRLNERLGLARGLAHAGEKSGEALESIVFRHAGWQGRLEPEREPDCERDGGGAGRGEPSGGQGPGLSEEEQEALAAVCELDLPADLKRTMLRAMQASFVRGRQDSVRP